MRLKVFFPLFLILFLSAVSFGQTSSPALRPKGHAPADPRLGTKKRFVLDVVRAAVALPQPDPQDRLRVLNSAASVAGPLDGALAKSFAREGAQIEAELISAGETPAVSLLASGAVECSSAANFVDSVPPAAVQRAEQSLLGALGACPKHTLEPIRRKLETALSQGIPGGAGSAGGDGAPGRELCLVPGHLRQDVFDSSQRRRTGSAGSP